MATVCTEDPTGAQSRLRGSPVLPTALQVFLRIGLAVCYSPSFCGNFYVPFQVVAASGGGASNAEMAGRMCCLPSHTSSSFRPWLIRIGFLFLFFFFLHINVWLPLEHSLLETWPATQACALTGNQTGNPLVHRPALSPLSHTIQG